MPFQVSNPAIRCAVLALLIAVSGCSLLNPATLNSGPAKLSKPGLSTESISTWRLKAKISVAHQNEAWSGGLNWHHLPQGDLVVISDPLGRTRLKATDLPHHFDRKPPPGSTDAPPQALLRINGEEDRYGDSLDQLLAQRSQLVIPLSYLTDWFFGRPVDGIPAEIIRDSNSKALLQLRQAAWTIDYSRPRNFGNQTLAAKIVIERPGTRLKVAITDWTPTTAEHDAH